MLKALLQSLLTLTSKKGSDGNFQTTMDSFMVRAQIQLLATQLHRMEIS